MQSASEALPERARKRSSFAARWKRRTWDLSDTSAARHVNGYPCPPTPFSKMSSAEFITNIDKTELKKFMEDPIATIVDVREVKEIAESGQLPASINIPLGTLSDALSSSEETFQKLYNKTKPALENPIVFSCRSGRRSFLASETAVSLGYKKVFNYQGGWLDWEQKN